MGVPPPSHFYQKICHPFGPRNRPPIPPPISLCLSQVLNRSACSQLPTTASSPNSKLAPISRVCLTSKILNRYLSPTRHFQGFSIKFNIDTGLKEIPRHIGQPRPPRKM